MIGYISTNEQGATDHLIATAAVHLLDAGLNIAGAFQTNHKRDGIAKSKMVLRVLATDQEVTISQNLGPHASGCALNPEALETAVHMVWSSLNQPRDLLLLNKFGKQERDGQGFRDVLVKALDNDIPVVLGVNATLEPAFQAFAGDFAEKIEPSLEAILNWVATSKTAVSK